jgi:glucose-1-phosphate thymidylyltransferase
MRAILLAAGFGTRMGDLGRNVPKGLMDLGGRTVLGSLLTELDRHPLIDEALLITNGLFEAAYGEWLAVHPTATPLAMLSDGTTEPDRRLGATGDLEWALGQTHRRDSIVLASDNLFTFPVTGIAEALEGSGRCQVCVLREDDLETRRAAGCVVLDETGRVVRMVEKPREPETNLVTPPVYAYTEEALSLVPRYLAEGGNPDAPGYLCAWLASQVPVMAWRPEGRRIDIGTLEKLEEARRFLAGG